jgi:hypothetical protein
MLAPGPATFHGIDLAPDNGAAAARWICQIAARSRGPSSTTAPVSSAASNDSGAQHSPHRCRGKQVSPRGQCPRGRRATAKVPAPASRTVRRPIGRKSVAAWWSVWPLRSSALTSWGQASHRSGRCHRPCPCPRTRRGAPAGGAGHAEPSAMPSADPPSTAASWASSAWAAPSSRNPASSYSRDSRGHVVKFAERQTPAAEAAALLLRLRSWSTRPAS